MSTPNLDRIRKNSDLGTAFVKFLNAKKLTRLYKNYYKLDDPSKAWEWFDDMTGPEKTVAGKVHSFPAILVGKAFEQAKKNKGSDLSTDEKGELFDAIKQGNHWRTNIYPKSMDHIGKNLEKLANGGFLKSKEYKAYVKSTIKGQAKSLRKDLKLEAEVDDIIGLAFAMETGDTGEANRISVQIAKAEEAAGRKGTKAKDIMKRMGAAVAKKFKFK